MIAKRIKQKAFQGENGMWGVCDESERGLLYESDMSRATAEAIADMENSENPPKDWEETKQRLEAAGLPC